MGILTNDGCGRGGHEKIFSREWVVTKIESQMDVVTLNFPKNCWEFPVYENYVGKFTVG